MDSKTLNSIIRFAEGRITYDDFELLTYADADIWSTLQGLISDEMKADPAHPIWTDKGLRMILESNGFSVKGTVNAFGMDNDFGRMRLHHIVGSLISYHFPYIIVKPPKEQSDADLLSELKLDYISGTEVDDVIEDIIDAIPADLTKKERRSRIKKALKDAFHIKSKHPEWVQEPEWPMGTRSPMAYVSRKRDGELVQFTFKDVDTGEVRVVEQLY